MTWLYHISTDFQAHLTFTFLYRCNNRGDISSKWFSSNSWCFRKRTFPLFLMDNIKLDEIPSKIKQKMWLFYIASQILQVLLIKSYVIQPPVLLFLDALHQQRTSFTIIRKKNFAMSFCFFHGFTPIPMPQHIDSQNPQSGIIFFLMPSNLAAKTTLPL